MSFLSPPAQNTTTVLEPKTEAAPPPPLAPGRKASAKSQQTTFLGSDATPGPASGNFGGKTLLGT